MDMKMSGVMSAKLSEWLLSEIQQRNMSVREFGVMADIPHSTLNKLLAWEKKGENYPSLGTLIRLAQATHTDVCALVAMLAPENTLTDAQTLALASRIRNLPPDGRAVVEEWLIGRMVNRSNKRK